MALRVWESAALKLAGRDEAIGWTDSQRAERIGLIVQNRRFLVLGKTRMPNLASRAVGLAVKALPAAWEQVHGGEGKDRRNGVTCSWPQVFERCSHSTVPAMSLINGKSIE